MSCWDEWITRSPDDQHRDVLDQVEAVYRADTLAAGVDDRAQRRQECIPSLPVSKQGIHIRHLDKVTAQTKPKHRMAFEVRYRPPHRRGSYGDKPPSTRERHGAHRQADLLAESPTRDKHQTLDELWELVGELDRDATAERVTDERGALMTENEKQIAQVGGKTPNGVVPARSRSPVSRKVRGDHGVALRQRLDHGSPFRPAATHTVDQEQDRAFSCHGIVQRATVKPLSL